MLFTASTIKDSLANTTFFVEANLASGVDHMFVFLDAPKEPEQREVAAALSANPHVTCLPTTRSGWWGDDRPSILNVRQRINANWVRALLEPFDWAEWLFHIDGDEVACLDREVLATVPRTTDAVWLRPLEAVSRMDPPDRPTQFKRLLEEPDLNLLHVLGALDAPNNQAYFHGHIMGKVGVRPGSGHGLTLHDVVSPAGKAQARFEDPALRLLHYDAISGDEFIRKWSALARAGHARYRPSRAPIARALKTLISRDMAEDAREKYLRRIYELTTWDDVELLGELGLLDEVDPVHGGLEPRLIPGDGAAELARRVEEMSGVPKRGLFVPDEEKDPPALGGSAGAPADGRIDRLRRRLRSG